MIVSGQVERVNSRDTQYGKSYSVLVEGKWYGTGKTAMGTNNGDWVAFEAEENKRGFWDVLKGTMKPAPAPASASKPVAQGSTAIAAVPYVDKRQDSIIYQSSRNAAIPFVELLHTVGAIEYGKAKGAQKQAIVELYVDKYTDHFVEETNKQKAFASQESDDSVVKSVSDDFVDDQDLPF